MGKKNARPKRHPNPQLKQQCDTCRALALVVARNLVQQSKGQVTVNLGLELNLNVEIELQS